MSEGTGRARVAIEGGTPAVRAGLATLLTAGGSFEVAPVALADVVLAVGLRAVRREGGRLPVVAVVENRDDARAALEVPGVAGVIDTDSDAEQISAAVDAAIASLFVISPSFGLVPFTAEAIHLPGEGKPGDLTAREHEVLALIADGLPNKAIAVRLGISENTVKFHAGAVLAKLGASSRAEAVMLAARRGLLAV